MLQGNMKCSSHFRNGQPLDVLKAENFELAARTLTTAGREILLPAFVRRSQDVCSYLRERSRRVERTCSGWRLREEMLHKRVSSKLLWIVEVTEQVFYRRIGALQLRPGHTPGAFPAHLTASCARKQAPGRNRLDDRARVSGYLLIVAPTGS